ncbi:MAG: hypothetical protein CMJ08_06135 [Pelagibacterales bacterium]|nr:hypothetical protein [Pelagibacterales bacterium]
MLYNKYVIRIIVFIFFLLAITFSNFNYLKTVFLYNKELNTAILLLFFLGVFLCLRNILQIKSEQERLSNLLNGKITSLKKTPKLLKDILDELSKQKEMAIEERKAIILFERITAKMDFDKEVNKYLVVVLVFLGLLGTFWGLLITIEAVGKTIGELSIEEDNVLLTFLSLKEALKAPLSGMGTAFATSLFGLAGSLSLGFVDLQLSKAQNDFLMYVEDTLHNLSRKGISNINRGDGVNEEYIVALLAETAEGIANLQKSLEKSENSRKTLEELVEKSVNTISKINDEINIRNNQFQKGEIISIEHLRNIDNNIEVLKSKLKDENILQFDELSSQIKVLAKTISLIKK